MDHYLILVVQPVGLLLALQHNHIFLTNNLDIPLSIELYQDAMKKLAQRISDENLDIKKIKM